MKINLYSQNRHTVVVDGIPLSGYAEGDYIEIDIEGNAAQRTPGGDGPAMNLSVAQGGKITIGLNPISPALGELYGVRDAQALSPRMFTIAVMTGVEEVIVANACAFGKLPSFSTGGPTMQPRKFEFECLEIKMDTSGIEAVAGGFIGGLLSL